MLLNRTNLTLSALASSNGLNLGTRSLAVNASVNDGDQTPRVRQYHHDVMREQMVWYCVPSIPKPNGAIPAISSSFFQRQQRQSSCVTITKALKRTAGRAARPAAAAMSATAGRMSATAGK
jgi:hypothetical protein